jgi:hypothetical protein
MPATLGNIPQNQVDAFPVNQGYGTGTISFVGGTVLRFWTPAETGVSQIAAATAGGATFWLPTNFLDVSGCRTFHILVRRHNTTALPQGALGGAVAAYYQYRFTATETPALSKGATENLAACAIQVVGNSNFIGSFPALQTLGETQTASFGWDISTPDSAAGNNGQTSFGTNVRFMVGFSNDPGANNTFSIALWASS